MDSIGPLFIFGKDVGKKKKKELDISRKFHFLPHHWNTYEISIGISMDILCYGCYIFSSYYCYCYCYCYYYYYYYYCYYYFDSHFYY